MDRSMHIKWIGISEYAHKMDRNISLSLSLSLSLSTPSYFTLPPAG